MSIRKTKPGECCELLKMVLARRLPVVLSSLDRAGLSLDQSYDGRRWTTQLTFHFRKAPRGDKSEWANTTIGVCNFCPFCGAEQ